MCQCIYEAVFVFREWLREEHAAYGDAVDIVL